ncbi:adenylosuccinate lyase [Kiritimatiellota bacterium B12222]|nr:adenylosuccinate lyase [Kiritimatiellota bacterium B12222]
MTDLIPNVLAERYASADMCAIWSGEGKVRLEREFWVAVMKAQKDLGLNIPDGVIEDYEKVIDQVNLDSIRDREAVTRHDVKARIEEFCELAGHEHIHKGMTSRDLTENVEQLQVFRSLELIRERAVTALIRMTDLAEKTTDQIITARTHNVAAQPTTLGKRVAMFAQELLLGIERLDNLIDRYPVRGLKGAVGTQLDQLTLFAGDTEKVAEVERRVVAHLGISNCLTNVGQVYPRSLDFDAVSSLVQLGSGPSSFCRTLRIMAGNETASEGFAKGQVGSSAMPHKMNSRSCERVNGFHTLLKGYLGMAEGLAGDQWNEGDVSCSVVRRVMLPDAFFAMDGCFETFLTILNQFDWFEAVIDRENQHYFPFLATTTLMMHAVGRGAGREEAHEAIKEHAVATVLDLRNGVIHENNLGQRLADDGRLGLSLEEIQDVFQHADQLIGAAKAQVVDLKTQSDRWAEKIPAAKAYQPASIL